jgi:hypothetical protein
MSFYVYSDDQCPEHHADEQAICVVGRQLEHSLGFLLKQFNTF